MAASKQQQKLVLHGQIARRYAKAQLPPELKRGIAGNSGNGSCQLGKQTCCDNHSNDARLQRVSPPNPATAWWGLHNGVNALLWNHPEHILLPHYSDTSSHPVTVISFLSPDKDRSRTFIPPECVVEEICLMPRRGIRRIKVVLTREHSCSRKSIELIPDTCCCCMK